MTVNVDKMGIFNQVKGTGDKIINLTEGTGENAGTFQLTANGKFRKLNIVRGIRSEATVTANQNTRENLLANLRATFGLENDADYMNKLKRLLGDDVLKSSDFAADANGKVHTDRPLTERRISAIVDRVKVLATNSGPAKIVEDALTDKAIKEFVAGVKKGKFSAPGAMSKFIASHFGGEIGGRLEVAMPTSPEERAAVFKLLTDKMMEKLKPALIAAGVTHSQLKSVHYGLQATASKAAMTKNLQDELAHMFTLAVDGETKSIAKGAQETRFLRKAVALGKIKESEIHGTFNTLMKSDYGRDIVVKKSIQCLWDLPTVTNESVRQKMNDLLQLLSENVTKLSKDQAYLFVEAICDKSTGENGPSLAHMLQRQLLGTVIKQYTDLTNLDLKQFTVDELKGYAHAAVDDSLAFDRTIFTTEKRRIAESLRSQNYTDAETREMIEFAHELGAAKSPVVVHGNAVGEVKNENKVADVKNETYKAKLAENKVICDNLTLLGRLFHREDVWTADALGGAKAIKDTLQNNAELVNSLKDNWSKSGKSMGFFSSSVTTALNITLGYDASWLKKLTGQGDKRFTSAIADINRAIVDFAGANDENAQLACCKKIAERVDDLMTGFSGELQKVLTKNLDAVFDSAGIGSEFKGLPAGKNPETAELLELAKSHHPAPKHETSAQRKERESAILAEYSKLVVSPQAGGLGTLIRSLATNYVSELDNREKRAMLSGALQAVTPELLTDMLQGNKSVFDIVDDVVKNGGDVDAKKLIGIEKDGGLPEPVKKMAGSVVGGLLKGAGPVFQKVVQMIGAEKVPVYLQKAVKDCKSNLKPIPEKYVEAKLAELVRQSNGNVLDISNPRSIGSASIAQAFLCDLRTRDGQTRTVVIKMMRPDVRGRMEREIAAIKKSVAGAGAGALRTLNARITSLLGELDFAEERSNIEQCQPIYGNSTYKCLHSVKLADGCPQLSDVLVMELAPGQTVQKYMDETTEKLKQLLKGKVNKDENGHNQFTTMDSKDRQQLETSLVKMYQGVRTRQANLQRLMQTWFSNAIFGDGKFHGDLHGGNVMADKDGQLTVIDFGNAPTFAAADRKNVVKLMVAAARGEVKPLLDAVSQLVSPEARKCLSDNFATLDKRLRDAFAIGGVDEVVSRITIVFGELARTNVEVPESLYNFVEAFGRVQQLSDSMTRTLERISTVLPYCRDHSAKGSLDVEVSCSKIEKYESGYVSGKSMDQLIDELLVKEFAKLRNDEPLIKDSEIFRRLREKSKDGGFDKIFSSYSIENNPIMTSVMNYGSLAIDSDVVWGKIFENDGLLEKRPAAYKGDMEKYLLYIATGDEKYKDMYDRARTVADVELRVAQENVEKFFGPYCQNNPALRTSLDNLKKLLVTRYAPEYIFGQHSNRTKFDLEVTPEMIDKFKTHPEVAASVDTYIQDNFEANKTIITGNLVFSTEKTQETAFVERPTQEPGGKIVYKKVEMSEDDFKKEIAETAIGIQKILCTEIYPAVVDSFKSRMREVIGNFSMDKFRPPVSIKDSIVNSVKWHIPTAIYLGGTDMLGLAVKIGWKALTQKDETYRANFNVPIDTYRDFAAKTTGRIHMTEGRKLETVKSLNKLTVHNAEAWRALTESLMADMKLLDKEFCRTKTWKKIAAIFEFENGENFSNIETAGELTPETLRRILAVRDMELDLDRTQPTLQQVTGYFTNEGAVEDTTYEQFNAKLTSVFQEEFGSSAADKLGLKPEKLDDFCKGNYGKIIAGMSKLAASDPSRLIAGNEPRPQDMRRWLIAATLQALKDATPLENGEERDKYTLEAVFGKKIAAIKKTIDRLKIFPDYQNDAVTAILLHVDLKADADKQEEIKQLLDFCQQESKSLLVPGQSIRNYSTTKQLTEDGFVRRKIEEGVDPAWKDKFQKQLAQLGLGMPLIAADDELYKRYVALGSPNNNDTNLKLGEDIVNRVRKSMYFLHTEGRLDETKEVEKILRFFKLKDQYEHPQKVEANKNEAKVEVKNKVEGEVKNKVEEDEVEDENEGENEEGSGLFSNFKSAFSGALNFFGGNE